MIRVMVIDDHASFRTSMTIVLDREPDLHVTGEAGSIEEAKALFSDALVDVALIDLDLAGDDGIELVRDLRARQPFATALILTGSDRSENYALAVSAGAIGVIHKSSSIEDVAAAVRRASRGEPLISPSEAVELFREAFDVQLRSQEARRAFESLSAREAEVLRALARGLDNQAIADLLFIGPETVRSHVARILRKLDVESRLQAVLFAFRYGFLSGEDLG
jgi:DNA-binding NarL/FixJ family response regulator